MAAKKKKKAVKKRAAKKTKTKSAPSKRNKTDLKWDLKKGPQVDGGPMVSWEAHLRPLKGNGHVMVCTTVATSQSEALKKAKLCLRSIV